MIIIVEGIDGSGKTTFCKFLSKKLKVPIIINEKFAVGLGRHEIKVLAQAETLIPFTKTFDFILDRGILTNIVYGKTYDIASLDKVINANAEAFKKYDGVICYIEVDGATAFQKIIQRENMEGIKEKSEIISGLSELTERYKIYYKKIKDEMPDKIFKIVGHKPIEEMAEAFIKECKSLKKEMVRNFYL